MHQARKDGTCKTLQRLSRFFSKARDEFFRFSRLCTWFDVYRPFYMNYIWVSIGPYFVVSIQIVHISKWRYRICSIIQQFFFLSFACIRCFLGPRTLCLVRDICLLKSLLWRRFSHKYIHLRLSSLYKRIMWEWE